MEEGDGGVEVEWREVGGWRGEGGKEGRSGVGLMGDGNGFGCCWAGSWCIEVNNGKGR